MAALPYMQLYIADYLADTMHLSTEEHGAYLLLMFNYWQTGRAIPKSRLAKIARLDNERWIPVEESLSEFFIDNGEEWIHERIEQDLASVHAKLEQRSAAGKASVAKRKANKTMKVERESNVCSTLVESSLERNANGNSTNKDKNKNKDLKELKDPPKSPTGEIEIILIRFRLNYRNGYPRLFGRSGWVIANNLVSQLKPCKGPTARLINSQHTGRRGIALSSW
ncbi:DUF1376 domain-containing protein [Salmonella enterica subsp. enterica serovar Schwarzengrund]|nr:DUF1376 domain-containing protein [Salmonella enterica]WKL96108.1 DUF1376 domain-containing protein [Salmonella enterica subsp. enterica serovar Schwarzengrund]